MEGNIHFLLQFPFFFFSLNMSYFYNEVKAILKTLTTCHKYCNCFNLNEFTYENLSWWRIWSTETTEPEPTIQETTRNLFWLCVSFSLYGQSEKQCNHQSD